MQSNINSRWDIYVIVNSPIYLIMSHIKAFETYMSKIWFEYDGSISSFRFRVKDVTYHFGQYHINIEVRDRTIHDGSINMGVISSIMKVRILIRLKNYMEGFSLINSHDYRTYIIGELSYE